MGNGGTKENQNVYFRARKQAAMYNERLSSREGAAEMLGISPSTLADYELGITKFVPVDKVVLMADLYNCPELRTGYCKYECPIGKHIPLATSVSGIEGIALRLIREFDSNEIKNIESDMDYDGCEWGDAEFEFYVTEQMKELALYPGEPETYLYADTEGERLPIAGGGWGDGTNAGVFNLYLSIARSYSNGYVGFRSAFYGKLDSEV